MSLVLNMVGGGGGGSLKDTDAILTVTVPTGSTVTMTKGGVTLTPTMWVQAADPTLDCALFVIAPSLFDSQNAWTVTATLGTDTASDTVTVSAAKQYDVELTYTAWIFREGVGAIVALSAASQSNATVYTNLTSYIDVTRTERGYAVSKIWTANTFDVTELNTLYVDMLITGVYDVGITMQYNPVFCVSDNLASQSVDGTNEFSALLKYQFTNLAARQIYSFDVSNISGSHYVGFFGCLEAKIYNIYGTKD